MRRRPTKRRYEVWPAGHAGGPTKKLPQVGQEPVEAVESRRSSPDAPMIIEYSTRSKDILLKILDISVIGSDLTPHFHISTAHFESSIARGLLLYPREYSD